MRPFQLPSLKAPEAIRALRDLDVDIGIMAYVLQFAPQEFTAIPRHGMIQFHPSLLPRYRGPSSINWPIIRGDTRTGLTIFRPTDGLDEGPILLQKETPIGPDDTLGSVYFERLFPMGIAALLEAADLVLGGRATSTVQDESQASYEGWCREAEARINWHNHVDMVYNLIRGCNPAPAAWTLLNGKKLLLLESRKHLARTFSQVKGRIGAVTAVSDQEPVRDGAGRADRSVHATLRGRQETAGCGILRRSRPRPGDRARRVRRGAAAKRAPPPGPAHRCRSARPTAPSAAPAWSSHRRRPSR